MKVISDQLSAIRKKEKTYAEVSEGAEFTEKSREEQRRAEKREAAEGFLSTRPDAPKGGAKQKIGPLRSE